MVKSSPMMLIRLLFFVSFVCCSRSLAFGQADWVDLGSAHSGTLRALSSSEDGHLAGITAPCTPIWSVDDGRSWSGGVMNVNSLNFFDQYFPTSFHFFTPAVGVVSLLEWFDNMELGMWFSAELGITTDSGKSWHGLASTSQLESISGPARLQYGVGSTIIIPVVNGQYGSSDGVKWEVTKTGPINTSPDYHASTINMESIVESRRDSLANSNDSGSTFVVSPNIDRKDGSALHIYDLQVLDDGALIAESTERGIVKKDAIGSDWYQLGVSSGKILSYRFGKLYVKGELGNTLFTSSNGGTSWVSAAFPDQISVVVPVTPSLTYLLAGNKIYKRDLKSSVKSRQLRDSEMVVSPNPATNMLQVNSTRDIKGSVTIVDLTGRQVVRTQATDRIDVSALPNGVYQLRATVDGVVRSEKFVITR